MTIDSQRVKVRTLVTTVAIRETTVLLTLKISVMEKISHGTKPKTLVKNVRYLAKISRSQELTFIQ